MLCCSIMICVTFLHVAEIFSLSKMKLNLKICIRRKPLLIFFLKAGCSNKKSRKKAQKIRVKQFTFRCFNSRACNFTEKWTSSQIILKKMYLKEHLLVTASKWRWFYDFQALWKRFETCHYNCCVKYQKHLKTSAEFAKGPWKGNFWCWGAVKTNNSIVSGCKQVTWAGCHEKVNGAKDGGCGPRKSNTRLN